MRNQANNYFETLKNLFSKVEATEGGSKVVDFNESMNNAIETIERTAAQGKKLIFIGNGASASIASHIATDFWKNARIRAITFNDASGLTCISNDFGYEHVFEKPVEMFSDAGDALIAISSSGNSENILRAVKAAKANGLTVITLSGFNKDNPLRDLGDINFYVPSNSYGYVEILHHAICHCFADITMKAKSG